MKKDGYVHLALFFFIGGLAIIAFTKESPPRRIKTIQVSDTKTVIKYIDFAEEIDMVSSNKNKPDTMLCYRVMDTLFVGYK